jgi:hypothetical protein
MGTDDEIVRESNPNANGPDGAAGEMGVSSERTGPTGPGQHATDGTRPTAPPEDEPGAEAEEPPEQHPGNPEENPVGIPPKAGYPSRDPRSD